MKRKIDLKKRNRFIEKYWPADDDEDAAVGSTNVPYPFDMGEVWKHVPEGGLLDLRRLRRHPEQFRDMSPKRIAEVLGRPSPEDRENGELTATLDDFFDGNDDPYSVATNLVGAPRYPGLETVRDTLFKIRRRRDVLDVRLSVTEIPNPEVPEDDDFWPQIEHIFIWTTAPLKQVKPWVEPLRLDGIGPVDRFTARGPDLSRVRRTVRLYRGTWD